ncbi:MAG: hypothetical protein ACOCYV_00225, partial [Planctomycetota bacterium]
AARYITRTAEQHLSALGDALLDAAPFRYVEAAAFLERRVCASTMVDALLAVRVDDPEPDLAWVVPFLECLTEPQPYGDERDHWLPRLYDRAAPVPEAGARLHRKRIDAHQRLAQRMLVFPRLAGQGFRRYAALAAADDPELEAAAIAVLSRPTVPLAADAYRTRRLHGRYPEPYLPGAIIWLATHDDAAFVAAALEQVAAAGQQANADAVAGLRALYADPAAVDAAALRAQLERSPDRIEALCDLARWAAASGRMDCAADIDALVMAYYQEQHAACDAPVHGLPLATWAAIRSRAGEPHMAHELVWRVGEIFIGPRADWPAVGERSWKLTRGRGPDGERELLRKLDAVLTPCLLDEHSVFPVLALGARLGMHSASWSETLHRLLRASLYIDRPQCVVERVERFLQLSPFQSDARFAAARESLQICVRCGGRSQCDPLAVIAFCLHGLPDAAAVRLQQTFCAAAEQHLSGALLHAAIGPQVDHLRRVFEAVGEHASVLEDRDAPLYGRLMAWIGRVRRTAGSNGPASAPQGLSAAAQEAWDHIVGNTASEDRELVERALRSERPSSQRSAGLGAALRRLSVEDRATSLACYRHLATCDHGSPQEAVEFLAGLLREVAGKDHNPPGWALYCDLLRQDCGPSVMLTRCQPPNIGDYIARSASAALSERGMEPTYGNRAAWLLDELAPLLGERGAVPLIDPIRERVIHKYKDLPQLAEFLEQTAPGPGSGLLACLRSAAALELIASRCDKRRRRFAATPEQVASWAAALREHGRAVCADDSLPPSWRLQMLLLVLEAQRQADGAAVPVQLTDRATVLDGGRCLLSLLEAGVPLDASAVCDYLIAFSRLAPDAPWRESGRQLITAARASARKLQHPPRRRRLAFMGPSVYARGEHPHSLGFSLLATAAAIGDDATVRDLASNAALGAASGTYALLIRCAREELAAELFAERATQIKTEPIDARRWPTLAEDIGPFLELLPDAGMRVLARILFAKLPEPGSFKERMVRGGRPDLSDAARSELAAAAASDGLPAVDPAIREAILRVAQDHLATLPELQGLLSTRLDAWLLTRPLPPGPEVRISTDATVRGMGVVARVVGKPPSGEAGAIYELLLRDLKLSIRKGDHVRLITLVDALYRDGPQRARNYLPWQTAVEAVPESFKRRDAFEGWTAERFAGMARVLERLFAVPEDLCPLPSVNVIEGVMVCQLLAGNEAELAQWGEEARRRSTVTAGGRERCLLADAVHHHSLLQMLARVRSNAALELPPERWAELVGLVLGDPLVREFGKSKQRGLFKDLLQGKLVSAQQLATHGAQWAHLVAEPDAALGDIGMALAKKKKYDLALPYLDRALAAGAQGKQLKQWRKERDRCAQRARPPEREEVPQDEPPSGAAEDGASSF